MKQFDSYWKINSDWLHNLRIDNLFVWLFLLKDYKRYERIMCFLLELNGTKMISRIEIVPD